MLTPQPDPDWVDLDGARGHWATNWAVDALNNWWDKRYPEMDGQDRHVPQSMVPAIETFRKAT